MPTISLGDYGAETSDSDDEEAPPAAPVGRVRDNTPVLVQCTRAYQTPAMPAPAPAVNPGQHRTRPWTPDEEANLTKLVAEHGRNWKTVAAGLGGGRTTDAVRQRWDTHVKPKDDAGTAAAVWLRLRLRLRLQLRQTSRKGRRRLRPRRAQLHNTRGGCHQVLARSNLRMAGGARTF